MIEIVAGGQLSPRIRLRRQATSQRLARSGFNRGYFQEGTMPKKSVRAKPKRASRNIGARPVFVMVHGGGIFPDDWYKPLVAAIERELGEPFDYLPVYYADVMKRVNTRALPTPEETQFREMFERELQKSFETARTSPTLSKERAMDLAGLLTPIQQFGSIAQEVSGYLFDANWRAEIQKRLTQVLDQAKKQSNPIILASLSLGTVVCFDVLKRSASRYRIALWYTCGSPLAKLRRVGRYDENLGAIKPQTVAQWYNIYDTTDWIADALGPAFPKPGYRLHDIFVNVAGDPISSHDYFNNRETIRMFADAIRTIT
jgi:hypothetical protein